MKKLILPMILISSIVKAASIDHIQTYSPNYLANQAQTGMINAVSANYNPAGISRLEKGKYIHVGLQYATGYEKMSYADKEHKAILRQAIPNFSFFSSNDNGGYYFTFSGIAGGGKLKYNGVSGIDVILEDPFYKKLNVKDNGSVVEGANQYEQITLGKVFDYNDKLSFSVAGRLVHGTRKLNGNLNLSANGLPPFTAEIDSKREAFGYGFQLGVNYKMNEKFNFAMRYDSKVKLNFKATGHEKEINLAMLGRPSIGFSTFYPQYAIDKKSRRDLPAILSLGTSYQVNDRLLVSTTGNIYFNKDAKMDTINPHSSYKNGWELALGSEYKLNNKYTLIGSINYAKTGATNKSYNDTEYALNSITYGTGIRYKYDDTLDITASVAYFDYNSAEGNFKEKYGVSKNQKYHKNITAFGLSITKKF